MRPAAFSVKCLVLGIALFLFAAFARGAAPEGSRGTVYVVLFCDASPVEANTVTDLRLVGPDGTVRVAEPWFDRQWRFLDVPGGYHSLRIDGKNIVSWSRDGVRTDSVIHAQLKPNTGISMRVLDDATGARIRSYSVHVDSQRLEVDDESPDAHDLFRVGFGTRSVHVHASGYGDQTVTVEALQRGKFKPLDVRLRPWVQVTGRVVLADGEQPFAGAVVSLQRVGVRPKLPDWIDGWVTDRWFRGTEDLRDVSSADRDGQFELSVLSGSYALHAFASERVYVSIDPFELPRAEFAPELILRMPAGGALFGRLGSKLEGLIVIAEQDCRASNEATYAPRRVRVGKHGMFDFADFPPGRIRLSVLATRSDASRAGLGDDERATLRTDLGVLEIAPGVQEVHRFDLSTLHRPGELDVHIKLNGQRASNILVEARRGQQRGRRASALSDTRGVAHLRGLPPGEYRVFARPLDGAWEVELTPALIAPESTSALTFYSTLSSAVFRCTTAGGAPMVGAVIRVHDASDGYALHVTNDEGMLDLSLPTGTFELTTGCGAQLHRAKLSWDPAAVVEELEFAPEE